MKNLMAMFILVTFLSCNHSTIDKKAEGEKLMQLSKEWSQAASTGDVEKTVAYWAENAVMFSAAHEPLNGKQAIRQMVEESFKIPGFKIGWQPSQVEVSESGDMAYILEDAQISLTDSSGKPIVINNKAVTIWRRQADGSWKNVVDISTPKP
ncbi:MAG: nuclear transport factor 2 family protein [Bacteroidota bacterium]